MKHPLVIERPDLQTWRQRAAFGALTAVFWAFWFWLWLPVATLVAWLFFGANFRQHMVELEGYRGFLSLLAVYGAVIAAIGGSILLWAIYNHRRFRSMERRRDFLLPTLAEQARVHGQDEAAIRQWRSLQVMTVQHDEDGAIIRAVPGWA